MGVASEWPEQLAKLVRKMGPWYYGLGLELEHPPWGLVRVTALKCS